MEDRWKKMIENYDNKHMSLSAITSILLMKGYDGKYMALRKNIEKELKRLVTKRLNTKAPKIDVDKRLGELFENYSDCYADTNQYSHDTIIDGEVVMAMTKENFIEILKDREIENLMQIKNV